MSYSQCLVKAIPPDMSPSITIDVHAHILPEATIRRLDGETPRVAPKLIDANGSTIMEINGKVVQNRCRARPSISISDCATCTVLGTRAAQLLGLALHSRQ
jgi:hypothetical protein